MLTLSNNKQLLFQFFVHHFGLADLIRLCSICFMIQASPFDILWLQELEVPIFGSLALSSLTGNSMCCLLEVWS